MLEQVDQILSEESVEFDDSEFLVESLEIHILEVET